MFLQVDKSYKDIMRKVNKVPLASRAGTQPGERLQAILYSLRQVSKYLHTPARCAITGCLVYLLHVFLCLQTPAS